MTVDHFPKARAAVDIAEALNSLLDHEVPTHLVSEMVESLEFPYRRLVLSLVPRIWPDPDQCPDGC